MKKKALFVSVILLTLALPAFAGGKGKKCKLAVHDCLNGMVEKLKATGFIGVELDSEAKDGALIVTKVIEGSPADKAGLQAGDELYALDGIKFNDEKAKEAMRKVKVPGKTVTCTVKRNGANRKFKLTLVPMPADVMAKYIGEHMIEHASPETKIAKK